MAECTALSCPRLNNTDLHNRALSITVPNSLITRDVTGHAWCNFCQKHRELMDYGHDHHWPAVRVQSLTYAGHYALLPEQNEWYISISCGNQDMIGALYAALIEHPKSV
jgi:hypothetical protein